jgi:adenine-specific DNA-methyltransferase
MAAIDDLIAQIDDPSLRARIEREVAELQRTRKFGLVFEQHLPELLPVYSAKPQRGDTVARRRGSLSETWLVLRVERDQLHGVKRGAKEPETLSIRDVVVVRQFGDPIFPSLMAMGRVQNGSAEGPWHTLIEADNYHALQLLEYLYAGQVDCIYIDPPYNTGARDWKYNNDYVDANDAWRHSKWLAMMRRRLAIASRLLKVDGVLIVTIDEHEVHHLGMLLEDLFPRHLRHVVSIVINPKGTGKHNFARVDEYAIFVVPALGRSVIKGAGVPGVITPEDIEEDSDDVDDEGEIDLEEENGDTEATSDNPFPEDEIDQWELRHARRRGSESSYRPQRPNQFYALYIDERARKVVKAGTSLPPDAKPSHRKVDGLRPIYPIDAEGHERCWRVIPDKMNEFIRDKRVVLGKYNSERDSWTVNVWYRRSVSKKLKTVWWETRHDAGTHGTTLLYKMLGRRGAFPFPKSLYAVRDCLAAVVRDRPNALIVDFFAGSGTTLHATALLNRADNGKRRCILVTNNEVSEKQAAVLAKKGFSPSDEEWAKHGICRSVAIPRCLAAITGKRPDGQDVNVECLTGRFRRVTAPRSIRQVTLGNGDFASTALRKELVALVGLTQSKVTGEPWHIEEGKETAILWDIESTSEFAKALKDGASSVKTVLVPSDRRHFNAIKETLQSLLPPRESVEEETLPMSDGFAENFEYFQLDFLDKNQVALKQRFHEILPLLWMRAGCVGPRPGRPARKPNPPYLIAEHGNFAVLLDEMHFRVFKKELTTTRDVLSHVFIVTDSHEAFEEMAVQLSVPRVIQLYRDYLENFMINKGERA